VEVASGKIPSQIQASMFGCGAVAFSPDGRYLIMPSNDGMLHNGKVTREPSTFFAWKSEVRCQIRSMPNIWNLTPGAAIRIVKTFRDCRNTEFAEGSILHYKRHDYLPYHSGHTVFFEERTMYLSDNDDTGAIVENRGSEYYMAE
jgi:hypothetical protein